MSLKNKIKKVAVNYENFPKPGIVFEDINPIFLDHDLCDEIAEHLIYENKNWRDIDAICAIESRGFFFAMLMAHKLKIPMFLVRKAGKLPGEVLSFQYDLEYGSAKLEIQKGVIKPGWRIMVHDDFLATGGTAEAAAQLIQMNGGEVSCFSFIAAKEDLGGKEKLSKYSNNIILATNE